MKKIITFILFFLILKILMNAGFLEIGDKHINDFAKILKETDKKSLEELLKKFYKTQNIEIKIIIINSIKDYIKDDMNFEGYVKKIFNSESIKFENRQNAILLFVAISDRKLLYESGDKISASTISNLSSIIDKKIIPYFKNEEYSRGIYDGIREFMKKTEKKQKSSIKIPVELFYLIAGMIVFFIVMILLFKAKKKKTKVIEEFGKGAWEKWG